MQEIKRGKRPQPGGVFSVKSGVSRRRLPQEQSKGRPWLRPGPLTTVMADRRDRLALGKCASRRSFLNDRARTYNEPFTIHLTKFDGTVATISNQGNA